MKVKRILKTLIAMFFVVGIFVCAQADVAYAGCSCSSSGSIKCPSGAADGSFCRCCMKDENTCGSGSYGCINATCQGGSCKCSGGCGGGGGGGGDGDGDSCSPSCGKKCGQSDGCGGKCSKKDDKCNKKCGQKNKCGKTCPDPVDGDGDCCTQNKLETPGNPFFSCADCGTACDSGASRCFCGSGNGCASSTENFIFKGP